MLPIDDPIEEFSPSHSSRILELLKQFNQTILHAISGPNCIDPTVCHGDCCFVHLDVPRALVQYYVDHGWGIMDNFQRGNTFSFEPRMDLTTLKCPFFDPQINGCGLHFSGVKIPQCWVYPTGLDPKDVNIACKRAKGWNIVDSSRANTAQQILSEYMDLCRHEAADEQSLSKICLRLELINPNAFFLLKPTQLAGIQDDWDRWSPMVENGWQLGLRSLCNKITCSYPYLECPQVCKELNAKIFQLLEKKVPDFIRSRGYQTHILFLDLFSS